MFTYTPPGGNTQIFDTEAKRDAYIAWRNNLTAQVEQERQRVANEQLRKAQSARTMAEVAPLMALENDGINQKLQGAK